MQLSLRTTSLILVSFTCFSVLNSCEDFLSREDIHAKRKEKEEREALAEKARIVEANRQRDAAKEKLRLEELALEKARLEMEARQKQAEEEKKARMLAEYNEKKRKFLLQEERRKSACAAFVGTQFPSLALSDGTELKRVTVTEADAIGITITYEHGGRRINFNQLPEHVRKSCNYDPKAADRLSQLETEFAAKQEQARLKRNEKARIAESQKQYNKELIKVQEQDALKGHISCKTISKSIGGTNKTYTISISAIANVSAHIIHQGSVIGSVIANQPTTITKKLSVDETSSLSNYLILQSTDGQHIYSTTLRTR